jgi:hypothetical protein
LFGGIQRQTAAPVSYNIIAECDDIYIAIPVTYRGGLWGCEIAFQPLIPYMLHLVWIGNFKAMVTQATSRIMYLLVRDIIKMNKFV